MQPLQGILQGIEDVFHRDGVMIEAACEPYAGGCGTDALTFKSFTIRWMVVTAQLVPALADTIWPLIRGSAEGAAGQCDGGESGRTCGYHWNTTTWDGTQGVGQQMSALAPIQAMMIPANDLQAPLTLDTGGTSKADPNAGTDVEGSGQDDKKNKAATEKITDGDRAGAGILTFLVLVGMLLGTYLMVWEGDMWKPWTAVTKA